MKLHSHHFRETCPPSFTHTHTLTYIAGLQLKANSAVQHVDMCVFCFDLLDRRYERLGAGPRGDWESMLSRFCLFVNFVYPIVLWARIFCIIFILCWYLFVVPCSVNALVYRYTRICLLRYTQTHTSHTYIHIYVTRCCRVPICLNNRCSKICHCTILTLCDQTCTWVEAVPGKMRMKLFWAWWSEL